MWILFLIILEPNQYFVSHHGPFTTVNLCFEARENVMRTAPQPKINYEAVCIQTDHFGDDA